MEHYNVYDKVMDYDIIFIPLEVSFGIDIRQKEEKEAAAKELLECFKQLEAEVGDN